VDVASALRDLANVVGKLGDAERKKQLLEEVLRIQEAHYGTRRHIEGLLSTNQTVAYRYPGWNRLLDTWWYE
jgi:hypothetical protein